MVAGSYVGDRLAMRVRRRLLLVGTTAGCSGKFPPVLDHAHARLQLVTHR
jgi:hypothetical protein